MGPGETPEALLEVFVNERSHRKPRRGKKQAGKSGRGAKRHDGHPKKPAPARKSSAKPASEPQPPEISPTIFEKLTTTQKRALEKFLNRHKPVLDELTPERIEELLSQARQEQKPDPAAQFEEAKLDAIDKEIWKPFRDRVANRVLAAKERKQQGADLADLLRDFTCAYSGCIYEVVADYADLLAQRVIASGKRITAERRDELVQDALIFGRNFADLYTAGPWFEMVIGEIPSELENHIVEALLEGEFNWREEASHRIALRAALQEAPEMEPAEAELPGRVLHGKFCDQVVSEIRKVKFMCGEGGKTVAEIKNEHPDFAVWDLVAGLSGEDQEMFQHPNRWASPTGYAHLILSKHYCRVRGTIKNWRKAYRRHRRQTRGQ